MQFTVECNSKNERRRNNNQQSSIELPFDLKFDEERDLLGTAPIEKKPKLGRVATKNN